MNPNYDYYYGYTSSRGTLFAHRVRKNDGHTDYCQWEDRTLSVNMWSKSTHSRLNPRRGHRGYTEMTKELFQVELKRRNIKTCLRGLHR